MNLKGADPRNGGRQPKDWLSGTLRGTFFDTDRLLAQLEVADGRAGLRLLHVGDRSWWYFCFLSFESIFERNYLILRVSSSCLFFLRVSRLYGGTRWVKLLFLRAFPSDQGFP